MFDEYWDVVIVDHLESCYVLKRLAGKPCVYVSHNKESELIDQKLVNAPSWIRKVWSSWVESYEISLSNSVEGIVSISNVEADWYRNYSNNVGVLYPVFNLVTRQPNSIKATDVLRVGFLGSGSWRPNAEALEILINSILPQTKRMIEFVLAGTAWQESKITSEIERATKNRNVRVIVHGYVQDIQTFWSAIDVFAAPIVSGAGVNVKVCESLANHVPVIAFVHAVRGLPVNIVTSRAVSVANSAQGFATLIDELECLDEQWGELREFSQSYAEEVVSSVLENMDDLIVNTKSESST